MKLQREWFGKEFSDTLYNDDKSVSKWLETNLSEKQKLIGNLRTKFIQEQVKKFAEEDPSACIEGLFGALNFPLEQKNSLLQKLKFL